MIIPYDKNLFKLEPPDINWYLKQVSQEELMFRVWGVIGLYLLSKFSGLTSLNSWWLAVIITTFVWSVLHLIGFKWQMFVATMILGIGLGWMMAIQFLPSGLGSILAFITHLIFGFGGYKLGIIQKWIN